MSPSGSAYDNNTDSNKQNHPTEYDSTKVNPKNYGGVFSLGASFGGGGVFGLPVRLYLAEVIAMELTVGLRALVMEAYSVKSLELNTYYTFGFDIFLLKHYIPSKHMVIKHGPFVKAGQSFDVRYRTTLGGFGWNYEHYRKIKQSFNAELGLGLYRMTDTYYDPVNPYPTPPLGWEDYHDELFIFWKVGWNFF